MTLVVFFSDPHNPGKGWWRFNGFAYIGRTCCNEGWFLNPSVFYSTPCVEINSAFNDFEKVFHQTFLLHRHVHRTQ